LFTLSFLPWNFSTPNKATLSGWVLCFVLLPVCNFAAVSPTHVSNVLLSLQRRTSPSHHLQLLGSSPLCQALASLPPRSLSPASESVSQRCSSECRTDGGRSHGLHPHCDGHHTVLHSKRRSVGRSPTPQPGRQPTCTTPASTLRFRLRSLTFSWQQSRLCLCPWQHVISIRHRFSRRRLLLCQDRAFSFCMCVRAHRACTRDLHCQESCLTFG